MRHLNTLTLTLAALALSSAPASANDVAYSCEGGEQIGVKFNGGESATITFADGTTVKLAGQPVGSGMHYADDGVDFRGKGDDATITREGHDEPVMQCKAVDQAD